MLRTSNSELVPIYKKKFTRLNIKCLVIVLLNIDQKGLHSGFIYIVGCSYIYCSNCV